MAELTNVTKFNISGGVSHVVETSAIAAAAAQQAVPAGKDSRLALRVANGGEAALTMRMTAGGGPRAPLGDYDVAVAAESTAYIALFDTARYKSGGSIAVQLLDADKEALGAQALAGVSIEAVQL